MKIKVENLKCFDEVAKVIGVANAKRELFKVVSSKNDGIAFEDISCVSTDFHWRATPQGKVFWQKIDQGINPYAN